MTAAIAWGLLFCVVVGVASGTANAVVTHVLRRRPRPHRPRPARPLGPAKPYQQRGTPTWVHRDPTWTERIKRIQDHAPRLTRRGDV